MHFAHPEVLTVLALLPLLVLAAWLVRRGNGRRLATLLPAAEQRRALSTARPGRGIWRPVLLVIAVALVIFAAARPQFGVEYKEVERRGVDVVIAIDVSASMLARDVVPDRLGQAKTLADQLLRELGSDRVAVLPFAGTSTLRWPLSFDHGAAKLLIDALDAKAVPRAGSGMQTAVEGALQLFTDDTTYEKVLVLLSDGEDHEGGVEESARRAEQEKLVIHAIGIGGAQGVPIPLPEGSAETFKHDRRGKMVYTRLETEPLQILSALTGGLYQEASYSGAEVRRVGDAIRAMTGRDLKSSTVVRYKERYQWFLLPAIALLAIEGLVGRRRKDLR